ncbi:MAG: hypothetical protein WD894_07675 [Pirellulales bacterium]
MKCDDFLLNYEAGSTVNRLQARLHARRCARCAVTRERLNELRKQLAAPAEISDYHRRVWERAAIDQAPEPVWRWVARPRLALAGGLAVAAALVVALVLSVPRNDEPQDGRIAEHFQPPTAQTVTTFLLGATPAEISELELGLNQIEVDLDDLAEEAARLEARQAISELAAMYQPLGSGDST